MIYGGLDDYQEGTSTGTAFVDLSYLDYVQLNNECSRWRKQRPCHKIVYSFQHYSPSTPTSSRSTTEKI